MNVWLADDATPARVAPTRVYRWERDASYGEGDDWVFRTDDDRHQEDAWIGSVGVTPARDGVRWAWALRYGLAYGDAPTADAARRACELAVLHGEVAS